MAFLERFPDIGSTARSLMPETDRPGKVLAAVDRLARVPQLDGLIGPLQRAAHALPAGTRDVLHGKWLGHPLHPALVQTPIGMWSAAAVLDLLPGKRRDSGTLVAIGLAAAVPSAVAGWTDWADLRKPQLRVGLVHAAANAGGIVLYAASLAARLRGRRLRGKALGWAGFALVGAGGALGGHLAYRQGAGANHAEGVEAHVPAGWQPLGAVADFPVGQAVRAETGGVPVLVYREPGGAVRVLADHCAHLGGPLSQGEITDGCVRCPWHGSLFRLTDGWNVEGPATAPQPAFEARVVDGRVEARLREPEAPS
ncbi:Rieske 2Fe-2S domain-containing protein [Streptomyces hoynatensis]|nr:Rieske (2Fe-2S) protein [Streptomyces hoynatensis]